MRQFKDLFSVYDRDNSGTIAKEFISIFTVQTVKFNPAQTFADPSYYLESLFLIIVKLNHKYLLLVLFMTGSIHYRLRTIPMV